MEKCTELFKKYIGEDRHTYTKAMFKILGTIIRGVNKGRFTYEQGLQALNKLGGVSKCI